ncbi:E3 ubiquitin-protein ligase MYLIP [Exaiptasia diaphana]|uniref:RING-type E3 ubiquitin transferase n=1 Tax=Exaiptasia diaphana TaxID=2652724 RepID=A0A913XHS4_EXADI|nr:E3 ubiquitin-protein ligase MYLIP [Exaiptasia diaphana]KXJ26059.1 E3 ubiquitin-protein ligase MYLIP [Exaiptasia diaphana]
MWCFISEPSGIIHEIFLPRNAVGQECFDKVCEKLRLVEKDYFGLKYSGPNGARLWLNMRNLLSVQLTGKQPHRLYLLVKFFVKPQELQQEISRHQFYLTLKSYIASGKLDLSNSQTKTIARICALIAQIDTGDFIPEKPPQYSMYIPKSLYVFYSKTSDLQKDAAAEHTQLIHTSANEAKIEYLHLLSTVPGYGVDVFKGKMSREKCTKKVEICVGNEGVRVFSLTDEFDAKQGREVVKKVVEKRINFEDVSTVSYNNRCFTVVHGSGAQAQRVTYKLKNESDAVALFRTFTEFHTFYQCNTVKRSVVDQCTRTLMGRLVSVILPSNDFGKTYLFDVQRTRRQAYSHAWNEMNSFRHSNMSRVPGGVSRVGYSLSEYRPVQSPLSCRKCLGSRRKTTVDLEDTKDLTDFDIEAMQPDELKKVVRHMQDARICQICMDAEVATAFCPCGHVVCCVECSAMCKECPLCRSQITYAQRVFFPCQ